MSSLFVRVREMVNAHAHHSLDEIENPNVMAQQVLRDLTEDLARAHRALVVALGAEKSLVRQRERLLAEEAEWNRKAEQLLRQDREDMARTALERALTIKSRAEEQHAPMETARRSSERLKEHLSRLKTECESARGRCAQIAANQSAAQALRAANRMSDPYTAAMERAQRLDQLSRKAVDFECQAEAAAELLGERDRFERDVADSGRHAAVEAALTELKSKVKGASCEPPAS